MASTEDLPKPTIAGEDGVEGNADAKTMSKNQMKKARRLEMKLKFRMEKRKLERERKKEKRKLAIAEGQILPPSRKQLRKVEKEPIDVTVAIDCSFEEFMVENDIRKLVKQIQHCYAINRRTEQPFKYHVTSYNGKLKNIIENLEGTPHWNVNWSEKLYNEVFDKEKIVYLSAESKNILTTLEEGKVYVIGGLVDHNSKKGLCHSLAEEKGIAHAQLPISEYIDMKCRKVLTIDHVFEILEKFQQLKDWESAFFSVIPKRKGAQSKGDGDGEEDSSTDSMDRESELACASAAEKSNTVTNKTELDSALPTIVTDENHSTGIVEVSGS